LQKRTNTRRVDDDGPLDETCKRLKVKVSALQPQHAHELHGGVGHDTLKMPLHMLRTRVSTPTAAQLIAHRRQTQSHRQSRRRRINKQD
jgi:hypothetical protein